MVGTSKLNHAERTAVSRPIEQNELFTGPEDTGAVATVAHARHRDPSSSHEAAARTTKRGTAANQSLEIVATLRRIGSIGMTADELDVTLFNGVHTAGKRLPDLKAAGYVIRTEAKRLSRSRINVYVWMISPTAPRD